MACRLFATFTISRVDFFLKGFIMGKRGALTKDKLGFSMPVDCPLYGRLPVLYKGVSMLIYEYVTSADAAAALLPAQLELVDVPNAPNAAIAMLLFAEYPWSTIGPYNE